ncbi:hypothetical protein [Teichococcus wenyumeiae]|uniref:hypothetical protein n=1 Tax=Teichococcus wenyumeiae TaxID=2478470 RepID=UPI0013147815|nr:hypothetical protein [Pseudoroseomonas wenyumeiae]
MAAAGVDLPGRTFAGCFALGGCGLARSWLGGLLDQRVMKEHPAIVGHGDAPQP